MWDLPGPGIEPVSPALAGGFLTTAPSRKPNPLGFMETSFQWPNSLNHWLLMIDSTSSPSPLPGGEGGGTEISTL